MEDIMLEQKRGVSIKEVEDAVQRAIESAEWARQADDARALTCLKSFLGSQNARSLLYVHLVTLQPEVFGHVEEESELKHLDHDRVCELYEAIAGAGTADIIDVKYVGTTPSGSAMYDMISCINPTVTVYVRMCRLGLRAETREKDFLADRKPPPARKPRGFMSFIKRIWRSQ